MLFLQLAEGASADSVGALQAACKRHFGSELPASGFDDIGAHLTVAKRPWVPGAGAAPPDCPPRDAATQPREGLESLPEGPSAGAGNGAAAPAAPPFCPNQIPLLAWAPLADTAVPTIIEAGQGSRVEDQQTRGLHPSKLGSQMNLPVCTRVDVPFLLLLACVY